ncbi:hypothetical protein MANAM107_24350 [Actinomyces capricornis]|uniref:Uncharacterized protein n=1 Tax=Actinomyces capricornis TaxID=2755559 RepID=A0ABM7UEK1_9ACTO|nr:hypothetical protein MANAM107_24350 [Actinomyces capricornis]
MSPRPQPVRRRGGRPASSHAVWVVGRRRLLDHQELARVLLALLQHQQSQETAPAAVGDDTAKQAGAALHNINQSQPKEADDDLLG